MADNIAVSDSTTTNSKIPDGTTIAADDVGGVLYQRVKLDVGGDGVSSPVTDLASGAKQDTGNDSLASIDTKLDALTTPSDQQHTIVDSSALPTGASTSAKQDTGNTSLSSIDTKLTGVAKDGTDIDSPTAMPTGGVGIRGWLSAIWTKLNGSIAVTGTFYQATQPVSGTVTANAGANLNTSALALETGGNLASVKSNTDNISTRLSESDFDTKVGSLTETAPATDTASSGLNGRLQRVAQRITSLIALFPSSLGQKTAANSLAVTLASDDSAVSVLGATTGSKVVTDSNGTIQQFLRGIVYMLTQPLTVASHAVTNAGTFAVQETGSVSSGTGSSVASSATNVTLLSSNASRKAVTLFNDSTQIAYVKFGATATISDFLIAMAAGSYFEFPKPIYTGQVDAIWASANGSMRVVEF